MKKKVTTQQLTDTPQKKAKNCNFSLLPQDEELINSLRLRYQKIAVPNSNKPIEITKSEIVRAGIHYLKTLNNSQLIKAIDTIEELKEGRPKKQ